MANKGQRVPPSKFAARAILLRWPRRFGQLAPAHFCGSTAKLTREHVWGEWLRQIVPAEMRKHHVRTERIGLPGTTNDAQTILRAGDPLSSKVKVVCARCNNGWLSQIQQRAKPHLIPLIKGGRSALNPDAQRAVATWCAMATMTGDTIEAMRRLAARSVGLGGGEKLGLSGHDNLRSVNSHANLSPLSL